MPSKLAEANHPVACPPQWLPVLLANTPVPPTNGRRLSEDPFVFTSKAELKTAVGEYDDDKTAAKVKYGLIVTWNVSGITDMSWVFSGLDKINEDISSWDTSGVTNMEGMFKVPALAQPPPGPFPACRQHRTPPTALSPLGLHVAPLRMPLPATRQNAKRFNKPLNFVTSSVTSMEEMFRVRAF